MAQALPGQLLAQFESIVGPAGMVVDEERLQPHLTEWRGLFHGAASLMVCPASTDQAAAVMKICYQHRLGVVPQGGNTGLVGGAIPHSTDESPEILVSLARMKKIRELDKDNYTITVEAGCLLAELQAAAEESGRLFPLSLAAEGSCQIGGNLSTNAGGVNVLRYGSARDLVLGIEAVLPDGRIFDGLRTLRKDNTGYDLKQLFVGAEGTLGLITAAACKLFPLPASTGTAVVAVADPAAAVQLYSRAREDLGDTLAAFELINARAMELVLTHIAGSRPPLPAHTGWSVLIEIGSAGTTADADLEAFLARHLDSGLLTDGVLAQSRQQRDDFWRIRHSISEAQKIAGAGIKHDIAVPVSKVPEFLARAAPVVEQLVPGAQIVAFGHVGDGNLHYNLNQPPDMEIDRFLSYREAASTALHQLAVSLGGSFSAEHGIGSLKTGDLARFRDPVELQLMRAVKSALDPAGIMNPGKLLP